jgi:myosin heavy subunit
MYLYITLCIHTYSVLISINPYGTITGLYDNPLDYFLPLGLEPQKASDNPEEYKKLSEKYSTDLSNMSPHVFKTANQSYGMMMMDDHNQSIIISGESGSGKTEGSKYVMNFLIAVNDSITPPATAVEEGREMGDRIKEVLLESNVVFESFGNAKTVRNDNSSRFGKYIRLQYTAENVLVSAFTETFLLERSRLTSNAVEGERRFHVFYGLLCGENEFLDKKLLKIDGGVSDFPIMGQPSGKSPFLANDAENFTNLCNSLRTLGTSDGEMREIFSLLSLILHISNTSSSDSGTGIEGDLPAALAVSTHTVEAIATALVGCLTIA